jgi:hypothetical protein
MSEQQVTNATIMREYFKTGIQERNGRHRQVFSWPELVRQQRARVTLKAERLARRNAA